MSAHATTLRLAGDRDAPSIAAMSRDLIEAGLGWKYDVERVRRALRDPDTVAVVACDDTRKDGGAIAGFAIMAFGDERAHLVLFAVRPSMRRRGIGRALFEWLLACARVAGMQSLHLELRAANEAAAAFYRAMGFSVTLKVPGYYRGREAALRMIRVMRVPSVSTYEWRPPA